MTDKNNLRHWDRFADIDPKYTKAITGKAYRGTSPNPQYVIKCLTDMFGPVGIGFGWRVVAESFESLGGETLHWCRIEFWHSDRANTYESYGQTKAAYTAKDGRVVVDEDAPKKSLTDAIIKAASHIGIAANIFLGRWDDNKYVAEVAKEYEKAKAHAVDTAPIIAQIEAATSGRELVDVLKSIGAANDIPEVAEARVDRLKTLVKGAQTVEAIGAFANAFAPDWPKIEAIAAARKAELEAKPADDLGGDGIPY